MKERAYLDTSVVLHVAYDEGASPKLESLVRRGQARRGPVEVVLVAPVLSELLLKLTADEQHVGRYAERIRSVITEVRSVIENVRQEIAPDRRSRPRKVGLNDLHDFASGLEEQVKKIRASPDKRRAAIVTIVKDLRGHAAATDLLVEDVAAAFAEEEDLLRDGLSKQPQPLRPDLLVFATVRRCQETRPGVLLTFDRSLRSLALERGLQSPEPETFANAR